MSLHIPVLVDEVLLYLVRENFRLIFDATVGTGGHAEAMLKANPYIKIIGIDRDINAVYLAKERLESRFSSRISLFCAKFSEIEKLLQELDISSVDAFFFDLGLCNAQLDDHKRGFSYLVDGPLDMQMGLSNLTAYDLVNGFKEGELVEIFYKYGEEPYALPIARAIVRARKRYPIARTLELARIIRNTLPSNVNPIKTLSRIFQAIRIVVNDELNELAAGLDTSIKYLRYGGRIGVISYHSLEDRIVKEKFRFYSSRCVCPPGLPVCTCGAKVLLNPITKHPIRPSKQEISLNKRARSARFRVAEKVGEGKCEN